MAHCFSLSPHNLPSFVPLLQLRPSPLTEPNLLWVPAFRSLTLQPEGHLAPPFRPYRWPWTRGTLQSLHTYLLASTYITNWVFTCWCCFLGQVDLVGGYYDAGDNVKFGLPMAFTITLLSWGVIEYGHDIAGAGQYAHALEAIKWGTDYFIKAHTHPHVLWAQVINPIHIFLHWVIHISKT